MLPDAQVGNSMPVRTVPHPPEKPPRKVKTYEKPMQGPLGAADESLYAQSTKKNLRFSSNVKHLEGKCCWLTFNIVCKEIKYLILSSRVVFSLLS